MLIHQDLKLMTVKQKTQIPQTHAFLFLPLYPFLTNDKTLKQKIFGDYA